MAKLVDLLQERFKLVKQAQAIQLKVETEKRDWTAEERAQYDKIFADVDAMKAKVDELQGDEDRGKKVTKALEDMEKPLKKGIIEDIGVEDRKLGPHDTKEYRAAFSRYLSAVNTGEIRALQMDLDTAGGYTVIPQQFLAELIKTMDAVTLFRSIARVIPVTNAESLGVPAIDADMGDVTFTTELKVGSEDTSLAFGKRELHPHPMARYILVSKKLVRTSALGIEGLVRDRLAYKCATVEENAFFNGNGVGQPLGVFVNSPLGISSTYDVSTDNTATAITADGVINVKYALRSVYWPRAKWIFHQSAIKNIRKLRGSDGEFLWKAGLASDRGDILLDCPVLVSEFAPSTFTTGLYVGIIGVFDYYWIADALDATIEVGNELYMLSNQNIYVIRKEIDGMPILGEAFRRVTLA
jgi:HK97 family phage major capsid protein